MAKALPRCLLLACAFIVPSFAADVEGRPITVVRFEPAQQPVLKADLARLAPFQVGTPLRMEAVRETIKKLYGTGAYSDIEIEGVPDGNGVALVIRTKEQFFVGPVEVRGKVNVPPNQGQLQSSTRLELGTPFEEADLQTATENMKGLLERNGLYQSKIDSKITRDAEHQQVALNFRVEAGKRARFTMPIVIGDTKIPAQQLAKFTHYKGLFRWRPATEENTQRGVRRIREKYADKDRLTATVSLDRMEFLPAENKVRPTIQANGGPIVKILTEGAKVSRGDLEKYIPVFDE